MSIVQPRPPWMQVQFPDPTVNYPLFLLSSLPDAPADFQIWGETWEDVKKARRLNKTAMELLCYFYFWGIDPQFPPKHLKYSNAAFKPISRWYPEAPDLEKQLHPSYTRPADADADWPDAYLERFLLSSTLKPQGIVSNGGGPNLPITVGGRGGSTITPRIRRRTANSHSSTKVPASAIRAGAGPVAVTTGVPPPSAGTAFGSRTAAAGPSNNTTTGQDPNDDAVLDLTTANATAVAAGGTVAENLAATTTNLLRSVQMPYDSTRKVIEAVERAVIGIAYSDLERHPSAMARSAPRPVIATGPMDVSKSIIASYPAVSQVRVTQQGPNGPLVLDPNGNIFACRGRGPVEHSGSGVLDCVIVAGKFLDAGSTNADRNNNGWHSQLTPLERSFIELTDVNWDVCPSHEGARVKKVFCDMLAISLATTLQQQRVLGVRHVWDAVGDNFAQFKFSFTETLSPCRCTRAGRETTQHYETHFLEPPFKDEDKNGVTMQELFTRSFDPRRVAQCQKCGQDDSVPYKLAFSTLPLRIVVRVAENTSIQHHTNNISFKYEDSSGRNQNAIYRWLGGIYFNGTSYRLFWTDTPRGETGGGEILTYSSSETEGLIIGGIVPLNRADRVPENWRDQHVPPLLFYERIVNPSSDVLAVAAHAACNMVKLESEQRLILNEHDPWVNRSAFPAHNAESYPWTQTIAADDVQLFQLAPNPYNPAAQNSNDNNSQVVRSRNAFFNQSVSIQDAPPPQGGLVIGEPSTFASYLPPLLGPGPTGFSPTMLASLTELPDLTNELPELTALPEPPDVSGEVLHGIGLGLGITASPSQSLATLNQPYDPADPSTWEDAAGLGNAMDTDADEQTFTDMLNFDAELDLSGDASAMCRRATAQPKLIQLLHRRRTPLRKRVIEEILSDDEPVKSKGEGIKRQKQQSHVKVVIQSNCKRHSTARK